MSHDPSGPTKDSLNDLSKLRVLVVDDDKMILSMVKQMLRRLRVSQVFTAEDGVEGLAIFRDDSSHVNLIICDLNMPRMNGIALLEQVRMINPGIPFMMLTATTTASAVRDARSLSVNAYIAKPFSQDQLRRKLEALAKTLD